MRRKTYQEAADEGANKLATMRANLLAVTQDPPKPERYLTTSGKKIFKKIVQHIIDHNLLCDIDSFGISTLAHNLDIYHRMVTTIEDKEKVKPGSGYFQQFNSGVVQKSPEVQLMDKALDNIYRLSKEYGLTVKSRDSMLSFSNKPTDEDGDLEDELNLN